MQRSAGRSQAGRSTRGTADPDRPSHLDSGRASSRRISRRRAMEDRFRRLLQIGRRFRPAGARGRPPVQPLARGRPAGPPSDRPAVRPADREPAGPAGISRAVLGRRDRGGAEGANPLVFVPPSACAHARARSRPARMPKAARKHVLRRRCSCATLRAIAERGEGGGGVRRAWFS